MEKNLQNREFIDFVKNIKQKIYGAKSKAILLANRMI